MADTPLEEIVVTASRRSERVADTAQAITVVRDAAAPGQVLLTEWLAGEAGVFVQQTTPGQGAVIVRGQRGSSVLHLVDGVRLNNAIFRSAPTQYFALVPSAAVERVEVMRGGATSLYGTDAVGGVVQVVTRAPEFSESGVATGGMIDVRLDSAELTRTSSIAWEIGGEALAARFTGQYQSSGDRAIGGGQRIGPSGYRSWGGSASVAGRQDNGWYWQADLQYMTQPETPRVDELVPGFGQLEPSSSEFSFAPNRRTFAHIRLEHDSLWWQGHWRFDASWQRIDDDRTTRAFASSERRQERNASDLYGLSVTVDGQRQGLDWLAGLEFYEDRVNSQREFVDLDSGSTGTLDSRFPDGSRVRQASAFVHVKSDTEAALQLGGGLRANFSRTRLPETAVTSAAQLSVNDVGADMSLRYSLAPRYSFVANLSAGFRAPNIFDLGTLGPRPGNRFNVPNTSLESERAQQLDAGIRFSDGALDWELVLFALHYDDRIVAVPTGQQTTDGRDIVQSTNAGQSDLVGLEFELDWAITSRINARLNLNAVRGEQSVVDGGDEPADRIPPLNGRLRIEYVDDLYSVFLDAQSAMRQHRLSARDARDVRINPEGTAGWFSVDAGIRWLDVAGWGVSLGLQNIADRSYRRHGSGIDAIGRNAYLSLQREF